MKSINLRITDLFKRNAVIEIIDLYEKYLLFPDLVNDNEFYCNCTLLSRFGKSCEYQFNYIDLEDDERSFTELFTKDIILSREEIVRFRKENPNQSQTSFIGLPCRTNSHDLDWRQICNGIVDCDQGEDEPTEFCFQMELNQCHSDKEFRCQTGLCLPISFAYDEAEDCPDQTDERNIYRVNWRNFLLSEYIWFGNLEWHEMTDGWKQFSCGEGLFISYSHLTSKLIDDDRTCPNNYHRIYLTKLFSSTNEDQCWKSMICLTDLDYLYSNLDCSDQRIEIINIQKFCPDEFYFPSKSVVYSYVFFLYDQSNRTNWLNYTGPNSICYQKEFCPKHLFNPSITFKNNLTCFDVDQRLFSWKNFSEYILRVFRRCYSNMPQTVDNQVLYHCPISDEWMSIHRLKDRRKDCFFNEDEDSRIELCLYKTNNHFQCLTNRNECVRMSSLDDGEYDCSDGTDEYVRTNVNTCSYGDCSAYIKARDNLHQIYRFDELCDRIINRRLFPIGSNETDETDCEYWPFSCDSPYTHCNQVWNCLNGSDEIDCPLISFNDHIRNQFHCNSNEHYCIQLLGNSSEIKMTCINLNRTGDSIIDCIGGSDERLTNICLEKYPIDFKKRFYCQKSDICIEIDQICDGIIHCPLEDDERICPWLSQRNSSKFTCENSPSKMIDRCDDLSVDQYNCQWREHLWFCDLALKNIPIIDYFPFSFQFYPEEQSKTLLDNSKKLIAHESQRSPSMNSLLCNDGYPVQLNNQSACLCSPAFYGDFCEYQSERLTVVIKTVNEYQIDPSTVFRLVIYLIDENERIISFDETLYNLQFEENVFLRTVLVYLLDKRKINQRLNSRSKSVRIDSYIIKEDHVQYISSWFYRVLFPFLPVNRLGVLLSLEDQSFEIFKCKKKCGLHGKCMYYINAQEMEYCWCHQGWLGEQCQLKSSWNLCNETSCAPHSQCVIINEEKRRIKCICPSGKSGPQCYIRSYACYDGLCRNNGTCLPLDQRDFSYVCICPKDYEGNHCQRSKKISFVSIPRNITEISVIPVVIVIFIARDDYNIQEESRRMYKNVLLPDRLPIEGMVRFGFIRMFHNLSKNFYYLVAIQPRLSSRINTSVISDNLCRNVTEVFNKTMINEYSYLKRFKLYHLPCQEKKDLRCFYDEYRMCICTEDHFSDCHLFDHEFNHCNYCINHGLCIRENPSKQRWNFVCLCPKCSFGRRCQFIAGNYFITLDTLIGNEIQRGDISFSHQSFLIYFILIILILIVLVSFIFNVICLKIFSNSKIRQVGCDIYLFHLTIFSQIGLILLFLRYLFTILTQIYVIQNDLFLQISCKFLEYFLRLIPSLFDWLTVCISIERAYTVIKDVRFTRLIALKTLRLSRWIVFIVFVLNILTTLHRPFYLILIDDDIQSLNNRKPGHPWCILDLQPALWNLYEKVINIFHLVTPLILNISSIVLFLIRIMMFQLKTTTRRAETSTFAIYKEQLFKYKQLLIGTIVIIILEIPRFVLTFALVCVEYKWQRYLHLTGYFISFLPLTGIIFIYILPSSKYKKELRILLKKICYKSFFGNTE